MLNCLKHPSEMDIKYIHETSPMVFRRFIWKEIIAGGMSFKGSKKGRLFKSYPNKQKATSLFRLVAFCLFIKAVN